MNDRQTTTISLILLMNLLVCLLGAGGCSEEAKPSLKIGVMLPLSGPESMQWERSLNWALENVNESGGVAGRNLELVYTDTFVTGYEDAAQNFVNDPEILGVIGPDTSDGVFETASIFLDAGKVFVTPSATAAEIFRAFAGKGYFWRTVESDTAQVKALLLLIQESDAESISLISSNNRYGATFFDWFGFFATELNLDAKNVIRYNSDLESCDEAVEKALSNQPDALVVAVSEPESAACIVRQARQFDPDIHLLLSDAAQTSSLLDELGDEAEGVEGIRLASHPESGFVEAHLERFGERPAEYAANSYDALLLLAYGLEVSGGLGGGYLAEAMTRVVAGNGEVTSWGRDGVSETLERLRKGSFPDISGSTGLLDYDETVQTDLVSSTYAHWKVENGEFVEDKWFTSGYDQSIDRSFASHAKQQLLDNESDYQPGDHTGSWALIAAVSSGWTNYRHQADALALYQILKSNGFDDDHILLILADDIADSGKNLHPGEIYNEVGGENLYHDVEVDYLLENLTSFDILHILAGESTEVLPTVVESGPGDNLFIFFVGHGTDEGLKVGATDHLDWNGGVVSNMTPKLLAETLSKMYEQERYRRVLLVVESCHSGLMGQEVDTPGVVMFTSSNETENSISTQYDVGMDTWLADEFSYEFQKLCLNQPSTDLVAVYESLYLHVYASHVQIKASDAGNIATMSLDEFLSSTVGNR